jgi:tetratricopeptide (TPR) repeat protein
MYQNAGSLEDAIRCAKEYLNVKKDDSKAYKLIASLYRDTNHISEAINNYKR